MTFRNFILMTLSSIATCTLLGACQTTGPSPSEQIDQAATEEGLVRVKTKAADAVYKRPEATLTAYSKVLLHPVEVQFAKNWDPGSGGSALYKMNPPDRDKIKSELAEVFAEVFKRDLEKGGYPLVNEGGPDVLELRAAIVNLYINAPDVSMETSGRTKVYTAEAGEMTLILQLHDSVTGQLLARAFDRRTGNQSGMWEWSNSVTNTAEAKRIISTWSTALRKALDASRAAG
jgi:Protein of unknown function (DUF3313)